MGGHILDMRVQPMQTLWPTWVTTPSSQLNPPAATLAAPQPMDITRLVAPDLGGLEDGEIDEATLAGIGAGVKYCVDYGRWTGRQADAAEANNVTESVDTAAEE